MTVRVFTDAAGTSWQVWAVHPPSRERRSGEDRRAGAPMDPWYERRRGPDRRVENVGRLAAVAGPLVDGWLCFETLAPEGATLRRRLAPIPTEWPACEDPALCGLLERATPVRSRTRAG